MPKFYFNKTLVIKGDIESYSTYDLKLKAGSTTRLNLVQSGTSQLLGNFEISGKMYFNDKNYISSGNELIFGNSLSDYGINIQYRSDFYNRSYIDYGHDLFFRTPNTYSCPLILQNDGSVIMGASALYSQASSYDAQGHKLVVNGSILCEEIKVVNEAIVSDFVFEEDYELRSLKEVEEYVNTHKHLPDVPSAKEFQENGYTVGEMDDILLRKIEELTLYVIELQKENEEQREIIEKLAKSSNID